MAINRDTLVSQTESTIANLVAERLALSVNPKPYYIIKGVTMTAQEYRGWLTKEITDLQNQLQSLQGPWEIREYKRPI